MSPRPGTEITIRDNPEPLNVPTDTATWFVVGIAERRDGRFTDPELVLESIVDFERLYGPRTAKSALLYDSVETYFREGGVRCYVRTVVGPAATGSLVVLPDSGAVNALTVTSVKQGEWGNKLNVEVIAGATAGSFRLVITHDDDPYVAEESPDLADVAAAAAWTQSARWVTVVVNANSDGDDPAVQGPLSLAGGTDDTAGITDASWETQLGNHPKTRGPGQVSMPGRTTLQAHTDLLEHALANDRVAILDGASTGSVSTLVAQALGLRALSTRRYGALFAPWLKIPGVLPNTVRTIPPSPVVAALMARSDAAGISPNRPAAGENGQTRYVSALTGTVGTDADRETLNEGGVNVFRTIYNTVRLYGYRTLTDPLEDDNWLNLGNVRLFMAIQSKGGAIAERYVLRELDGKRVTIGQYGGELTGMLLPYFNAGSLFGESPEEAFSVNVGPQVNTTTTIQNGELRAVISMKMSPFAELVVLELVKVRLTEAIA